MADMKKDYYQEVTNEIIKAIEKFEKEHKVFIVDINYDGYDKGITYTFAG